MKIIKTQTGVISIIIALICITVIFLVALVYRQMQMKNLSGPQLNSQSQTIKTPQLVDPIDFEIKEWGVKFSVPASYRNDLYYQLGALSYEQNPSDTMAPAGEYVSFSFKSLAADYPKCGSSYQKVALLHRAPLGRSHLMPVGQEILKSFKSVGDFEYSYALPREECIEGSFPYHEADRKLYNEFRTAFPQLVSQLKSS